MKKYGECDKYPVLLSFMIKGIAFGDFQEEIWNIERMI